MDLLIAVMVWIVGLLCALAFFAGAGQLRGCVKEPLRHVSGSTETARPVYDE